MQIGWRRWLEEQRTDQITHCVLLCFVLFCFYLCLWSTERGLQPRCYRAAFLLLLELKGSVKLSFYVLNNQLRYRTPALRRRLFGLSFPTLDNRLCCQRERAVLSETAFREKNEQKHCRPVTLFLFKESQNIVGHNNGLNSLSHFQLPSFGFGLLLFTYCT